MKGIDCWEQVIIHTVIRSEFHLLPPCQIWIYVRRGGDDLVYSDELTDLGPGAPCPMGSLLNW